MVRITVLAARIVRGTRRGTDVTLQLALYDNSARKRGVHRRKWLLHARDKRTPRYARAASVTFKPSSEIISRISHAYFATSRREFECESL